MASGTIQAPISLVEVGTTTDNNNRTWQYRKYSDGTIDLYLTGTSSGSFVFTAPQSELLNGMYRRQEIITIPILTDILWGTASGSNSCYFISALQKNSSNQVIVTQQGINGTSTNMWISIYIKGTWR